MLFKTEFKPLQSKVQIRAEDSLLMIGSCFAENISQKLTQLRWNILTNPHGILFNPASVQRCISDAVENREYDDQDLEFYDGLYHSLHHHGNFSNTDKNLTLAQINSRIGLANRHLQTTDWCILTLGSSWVYRHIRNDELVANCHKIPQSEFTKEILSVPEITRLIESSVTALKTIKPDIKIILTVSPVRYLKDGFIENTRSKAHLLTAVNELIEGESDLFYFPAFEIFMDDLRDYRFTKDDMVHPNDMAVQYIYEKFVESFFEKDARNMLDEIEHWVKMKLHRPIRPDTTELGLFHKKLEELTYVLAKKYPHLEFVD